MLFITTLLLQALIPAPEPQRGEMFIAKMRKNSTRVPYETTNVFEIMFHPYGIYDRSDHPNSINMPSLQDYYKIKCQHQNPRPERWNVYSLKVHPELIFP